MSKKSEAESGPKTRGEWAVSLHDAGNSPRPNEDSSSIGI